MAKTRLLVLGGTALVGRKIVEEALARGFHVTTFNRGVTNPNLFPEVDKRFGDRNGGLSALGDDVWDFVVDTCGYAPDVVDQSASLLKDRAGWYSFISSLAVHPDFSIRGLNEESPLAAMPATPSDNFLVMYGPLKVLCERVVQERFKGRSTIVRPGLIVGPHDATGRFTHWLARAAEGGDVLAPGAPHAPVQFIDARDLANFTLDCAQNGTAGVFNATGPIEPTNMGALLDACAAATGGKPRYIWCNDAFLLKEGLQPYFTPPIWTPIEGPMSGMGTADCRKAYAKGLRTRPVAEILRDTYAWWRAEGAAVSPVAWPRAEEKRVLERWAATH